MELISNYTFQALNVWVFRCFLMYFVSALHELLKDFIIYEFMAVALNISCEELFVFRQMLALGRLWTIDCAKVPLWNMGIWNLKGKWHGLWTSVKEHSQTEWSENWLKYACV